MIVSRPTRRRAQEHGQEEGRGRREDPDPGRQGHAGPARGHRARPPRRRHHGLLQAVQRRHREPGRHHRARRDHRLRGPGVHVHPQDAAHAGAAARGGRPRQGLDRRRARPSSARSPRPRSRRSPRSRCPTSTPTTSRRPRSRCGAPPAPWASRSSEPATRATPAHPPIEPGRPRPDGPRSTRELPPWQARSTTTPASASTGTSCSAPAEALDLVKNLAPRQVRRDRRAGRAPRRRPPQGRPDGAGHRRRCRRARARTSGSAVFAAGEAAAEAREAGADIVGADDLAAEIEKGNMRLRRGHRHAGPDAARRPARPGARPARPHAQPQDRHGHHRRRQGRDRLQGRQGRVPHRPLRQRPRADRQGRASAPTRSRPTSSAVLDELQPGQAGVGQGPVPAQDRRSRRRWGPASGSTPPASAPRPPRTRTRRPARAPVDGVGRSAASTRADARGPTANGRRAATIVRPTTQPALAADLWSTVRWRMAPGPPDEANSSTPLLEGVRTTRAPSIERRCR